MKIAYVVSNDLDAATGSRTHILEVFRGLSSLAEVRMYVRRPVTMTIEGPEVVTLSAPRIRVLGVPLFQAALALSLFRDVSRRRPDVLYSRFYPFGVAPLVISSLLQIPLVIEINGLVTEDLEAEHVHPVVIMLASWSERLHCRRATEVVVVTEGIAKDLGKRGICRNAKVIANGVDCGTFTPHDRIKTAEGLGLDPSHEHICFVGNLAPWQGVEFLIDAMAILAPTCPTVRLLIVGDGAEKETLMRRAVSRGVKETCIFTGSVPYEKVPLYISASTICAAPFVRRRNIRTGLSPLKIYEYLACGRPVVASDVGGVREVLTESGAGELVPPESPEVLAATCRRLLHNPDRDAIGRRGREYIHSGHCWSHVAARVLEVCRSAAKEDRFSR